MSAVEYRFLEPLDVLFLRGNKLFGDPGSFGESLIPPWPSVAAGALRSRMLADAKADLHDFATWPNALGTPSEPGPFMVTAFQLAQRHADDRVEALFPMPADLVVSESSDGTLSIRALTPSPLPQGISSSAPLPLLPVLAETERSKPASGYWLTESGWKRYLAGETPTPDDLVKSSALWQIDPRVGVGLDADTRRAADGRLFSVQAVAFHDNVGFLAGVTGAEPPTHGTLRLGGDGRAAAIHAIDPCMPQADFDAIAAARRCRLVLSTPGIFGSPRPSGPGVSAGWLPTGVTKTAEGEFRFDLHGVKGRLVCAAVPRAEVVSGWDLAKWQPKSAQRAAPTGSVWWLDELEATPDALRKLAERGLWNEPCEDAARRAEGFNRVALAAWR
jgi:CRISPR-associated protein Cmr3